MAVSWPGGSTPNLPNYPSLRFTKEMPSTVVQGRMKAGPPKTRSASTFQREQYTTTIEIDWAQYGTWNAFWANINRGADVFEWQDWIDEGAANFKFDMQRPPRIQNVNGGAKADRRYSLTFTIEKQTG